MSGDFFDLENGRAARVLYGLMKHNGSISNLRLYDFIPDDGTGWEYALTRDHSLWFSFWAKCGPRPWDMLANGESARYRFAIMLRHVAELRTKNETCDHSLRAAP